MSERRFQLPDSLGVIVFPEKILSHIYSFAQTSIWSTEAGGQLFSATPEQQIIEISVITGPYSKDRRSRNGFFPNVQQATDDRNKQFKNGLHAVGIWHTHPERLPTPSLTDRKTTKEHLNAFEGEMHGFLLVILGNQGRPYNMVVWLAQRKSTDHWVRLTEVL